MGSRNSWDEDHFVTAVQQKVSECAQSVSAFGESCVVCRLQPLGAFAWSTSKALSATWISRHVMLIIS